MSVKRPVLTIGWDKQMDTEYSIHLGELTDLPFERMQQLRAIIPVAIAELERYWREFGPVSREMAATQAQPSE